MLTPDFRTGSADGHQWHGAEGLREFLRARSESFDENHEVGRISDARPRAPGHLGTCQRRRAVPGP
ncbi:hypothetical protein GCM10012280_47810 [Wenjunlia tyrosinilytica]|uniref:Uncharacterized protein n=1 Tax=Wenjunlia tyrosinilytica TaxID=1544741 RepID=A0A917ZU51_9ACTN|nr:hypothetical protein GCM10012280_47810 [Wenjunlia tyrosinilytica]